MTFYRIPREIKNWAFFLYSIVFLGILKIPLLLRLPVAYMYIYFNFFIVPCAKHLTKKIDYPLGFEKYFDSNWKCFLIFFTKFFLQELSFPPKVKMPALARKQTIMIKILIWDREYQKKINCPKTHLLLPTFSLYNSYSNFFLHEKYMLFLLKKFIFSFLKCINWWSKKCHVPGVMSDRFDFDLKNIPHSRINKVRRTEF